MRSLDDAEPNVRRYAIEALGAFGADARRLRPRVERALKDPDANVKIAALRVLGVFGPVRCAPLAEKLTDPEEQVAVKAAEVLASSCAEFPETVPALARALGDDRYWVRRSAIKALGTLGPRSAPAVPALVRLLGPKSDTAKHAARALGKIGPDARDAVPALEKLLASADGEVRAASKQALAAIGKIAKTRDRR
jgi:HEAT repeat protein